MSGLMTFLVSLSLIALAALSIFRFTRDKNWRVFIVQIFVLALCFWFLHAFFGFPIVAPAPRGGQDVYLVIILYVFMVLGMFAHYAYTRFEQPKRQRPKFDFGLFLAPIFASPIIFIPLLAALQNAEIDLTQLTVPKTMVFFVAFENGFFWKEYFDHRRQQKAEGEK